MTHPHPAQGKVLEHSLSILFMGPNPPQRYDLDVRMLPTTILHELECICRNRVGIRPNRRSNAAVRRVVGDSPT